MAETTDQRMAELVALLRRDPVVAERLPMQERSIVQDALDGQNIHDLAATHRMSENAIWELLGNAARAAAGLTPEHPVETGGLGSDTDPGVTGGYGDTAFGGVGNEPPFPVSEEPSEDE